MNYFWSNNWWAWQGLFAGIIIPQPGLLEHPFGNFPFGSGHGQAQVPDNNG